MQNNAKDKCIFNSKHVEKNLTIKGGKFQKQQESSDSRTRPTFMQDKKP